MWRVAIVIQPLSISHPVLNNQQRPWDGGEHVMIDRSNDQSTDHFLSRRRLIRGAAALGVLASTWPALAQPRPPGLIRRGPPAPKAAPTAAPKGAATVRLPARTNFIIRNAFVMTMEHDTGDLAGA